MNRHHGRGFTLIEMAIAVFILALLLGSILVPLTTQVEQRQISDAQKILSDAREAIFGYAISYGYLPCPDKPSSATAGGTPNDGLEDLNGTNCSTSIGLLPHITLGLAPSDPWGNRIRYRVSPAFTDRAAPFALSSAAIVRICEQSACTSILTNSVVVNDEAVFAVLSNGKNGLGAMSATTFAFNNPPTSLDEITNTGSGNWVNRTQSGIGSGSGEFDDILLWTGRPALMKFMVQAGRLP